MSWGLTSLRSSPAASRWIVVHTQPHREVRAASSLKDHQFQVFLPLKRRTVRHARQFRVVLRALFPRYLFVGLDPHRGSWARIRSAPGVSQVLMDGELPRAVPPGVVERLIELSDSRGVVDFDRTFSPGQSVRITAGPFAGLVGTLASADDAGRVQVLLDILGTATLARGADLGLVPAA